MAQIDRLTPEQEALLEVVRDEWLAVGFCTDRAQRPEAEGGVKKAYEAANLEPPKKVLWFESPLAGFLATTCLLLPAEVAKRNFEKPEEVWNALAHKILDDAGEQGEEVRKVLVDLGPELGLPPKGVNCATIQA